MDTTRIFGCREELNTIIPLLEKRGKNPQLIRAAVRMSSSHHGPYWIRCWVLVGSPDSDVPVVSIKTQGRKGNIIVCLSDAVALYALDEYAKPTSKGLACIYCGERRHLDGCRNLNWGKSS